MSEQSWLFAVGDRVLIKAFHPWRGFTGQIVEPWRGTARLDWLVELDNGVRVGARNLNLRKTEAGE